MAITIFAKLGAFLLSSKSYRAVVPSIFRFPRICLFSLIREKMTSSARSCWSAIIWCPTLSQQSGFRKVGCRQNPRGRADRRKRAAAGEGREAWLRNSDSVANQAEQLRDPGLSSRNLLLRLSVRFFAGRPARRILVNGLQLRLLSSDLGSTSYGLGAFDESPTVTCVVLERD